MVETESAPKPTPTPRSWREGVPGPFLAALALAGGFTVFVAWDQSHWWRVKEDYSFGWLVPVFTVYAVSDRWERLRGRLRAAAEAPPAARRVRWTLNIAAGLGLVFGALFFLLGAFYRAGAGTSQPGTLALTLGMVAIVLPLLFFNVPLAAETGQPRDGSAEAVGWLAGFKEPRFAVAALFIFPVCVWLISAPLVSAVESQISLFLLRKVVTVVAFVFDLAGCPIEQQGNVLLLPRGPVGVADACSGIRSLTACLFAGSFLGAMFLDRFWKKAVLVCAAMAFAFLMNLARSLFLTAWAYNRGPDAITGFVHDAAGYAVLGLTCLGLLVLVPLLNLKVERAAPPGAGGGAG
ncbi:MAG: exosortase [Opitutus sp.]|nr:exosortase [Opitutus sp.]